uniref:Carboxylesterase type B domain-containing protein n=1 Tax=Arion vulgaris TaxID=1028688 RepID=A0A0B7A536_9EUPU
MRKSQSSHKYSRTKSSRMGNWKICGIVSSVLFVTVSAVLFAVIWSTQSSSTDAATTPHIVATPVGRFIGVTTTSSTYGKSFVTYKSIPFAKPPLDDLRFKRPQPLSDSDPNQIINSDQYQKSCWSVTKKSTDKSYGEDCLYLNVYVPVDNTNAQQDKKLPVMIWIHGGGFVAGSTFPEPEKLVLKGGVIVVTINFRLGVFGFLTTQEDALPSNNGLWDQYMAIKWVKNYINFFEGDDTSITLFGESSGAISTALHVISPISSSLFKKAILQSGGATGLISRDAKQRAYDFASMVGCTAGSPALTLAACLRRASIADIQKFSKPSAFNISLAQQQIDFIWMPIVDGEFIPDEPLKLLTNITYLKGVGAFDKDFIIGVLNNEGALVVQNFVKTITLQQLTELTFVNDLTEVLIRGRYGKEYVISKELKERIYSFYTGFPQLRTTPLAQNVMDLAGDITFIIPAIELALAVSTCNESTVTPCANSSTETQRANCSTKASKLYLYQFDYCPQSDPCVPTCMMHGADVAYEFPRAIFPNPVQQQLSDIFVDILTTFARNSDPGSVVTSGWPTFDILSQRYLRLDISPSVRQYMYDYRVNFWLNQVPQFPKT